MAAEKPRAVHRLDYRPPDYTIDEVWLDFELHEDSTRVSARLAVRRNAGLVGDPPPLVLDGEALELESVAIDGRVLSPGEYHVGEESLEIPAPPERFEVETRVRIQPQNNTALSGLYKSSGNFCTQCEAHGFRRITYFLDRPDVMARYRVRVEAERARYPVLLSNGNREEVQQLEGGRHAVVWRDPFPKPCYLFALVAGDLRSHRGSFTTRSGREVALEIWVEPRNIDRCEHALRSLVRAMRWDEETFGLEYDLDVYMIVAVGDFNLGAMENKGLNIFNSKYVLAKPETATDDEYEAIEGVIGHEYFHNWTGNRVTCRDWFQLTLKEGLTVFRDQQFSSDMTSAPVRRIRDVVALRTSQFPEDAGPLAHPIRPESYISMDNFYSATVYEKGAEVVRLYHTLLGAEGFRRGIDLYFARHDGRAVTCDDFRRAMADANGRDLSSFERWYAQAGTPLLEAEGAFSPETRSYELTLSQSVPAPPTSSPPDPLPIPVRMGLVGADGRDLPLVLEGELEGEDGSPTTRVLLLDEVERTFRFREVAAPPVVSLLRGYSAPVKLAMRRERSELAFLLAHDSDPVSRWDAGQTLAQELLLEQAARAAQGEPLALDPEFSRAFARVLADPSLDGSIKSLMLELPSLRVLGQEMEPIDYAALHAARQFATEELAREHRTAFEDIAVRCGDDGPYRIDKPSIDRRRLRNAALRRLGLLGDPTWIGRIARQCDEADNMTDRQAALSILVDLPTEAREEPLARFHARWKEDPLMLDKWFSLQALSTRADTFERVWALYRHPDFKLENPNRVRALVGAFASANPVRFHAADGRPYAFLADVVLSLDRLNPLVAARLASAFNAWRRFDTVRQAKMHHQLERIARSTPLSKDVYEIVTRALQDRPSSA